MSGAADRPSVLMVGYGLREIDRFVALLRLHNVAYVGDVRSVPYSGRRPQFSREPLERTLRQAGIRYVFLGDVLGGRPNDPDCYDDDGHVDYDRCRAHPSFATGIRRVEQAYTAGHRLALMCSEARPEDCHRTKLLAEMLAERSVTVIHIDEQDELVDHEDIATELRGAQLNLVSEGLGRSRRAYRVA